MYLGTEHGAEHLPGAERLLTAGGRDVLSTDTSHLCSHRGFRDKISSGSLSAAYCSSRGGGVGSAI